MIGMFRKWRVLVVCVLLGPFVLTLADAIFDSQPNGSFPENVLVARGGKPPANEVHAFIVRLIVFKNGDFDHPLHWVERLYSWDVPGKGKGLTIDGWGRAYILIKMNTDVARARRDRRWSLRFDCDLRLQSPVGDSQSSARRLDYEMLDGRTPVLTDSLRSLYESGMWSRLFLQRNEYVVHCMLYPVGEEKTTTQPFAGWWAENGKIAKDRWLARGEGFQRDFQPAENPLISLVRRVSGIVLTVSIILGLLLINGSPHVLRNATYLTLGWIILALATARSVEAIRIARLGADNPETRRRAAACLRNAGLKSSRSTRALYRALRDADRRVVYEVLRGLEGLPEPDYPPEVLARLKALLESDPAIAEQASYVLASRKVRQILRKEEIR